MSGTVQGTYSHGESAHEGQSLSLCSGTYPQRADDVPSTTTARASSPLVSDLPRKRIPLQQIRPLPRKLSQPPRSAAAKPYSPGPPPAPSFLPILCVQEQSLNVAKVMLQRALNAATTDRKSFSTAPARTPFRFQYVAPTRADSTLRAQEHAKRCLAHVH